MDTKARTSIKRLYAAGECACTGLHGANRLASNSLLEAIVYADSAAKDALSIMDHLSFEERIPLWNDEGTRLPEEMKVPLPKPEEVGQIMSTYRCIIRSICS